MTDEFLTVTAKSPAERTTVLTAVGEIDHDSRRTLDDAADEALRQGHHRLVIDLSEVTFCDSGGLNLFVDLHRKTIELNGGLRLAGMQPAVAAVVRATNLDRLLSLHPTADQAVAAGW